MTEKEIKEYMIGKIEEIKKETECDDCILFIGKDGDGGTCAGLDNEAALVAHIWQVVRAFGSMGENPLTRQACLLIALTQHLIDEMEDDPLAEEESGMVKRISKRGKPEAEDDPSVEK